MDHKSLGDAYSSIYGEGFKAFPQDKVAKQADKKPQTRRNQAQSVKMKGVADAHKGAPDMAKQLLKSVETHNRKTGLDKTFKKPSAKNAFGNKADSLEKQRRSDLDKRYGTKKEEAMRNIDLKGAYASMYGEKEQIDELAPVIAAAAGGLAKAGAAKAATAGAAKMGGGIAKAAGSKLGQKAIGAGSQAVGNKVTSSLSNKNEGYTAQYAEGYKELPWNKMQDKASQKPDTARGESQARKMDTVRKATKAFPKPVEKMVKSVEMGNKKKGLERKFNAPSADNASEKGRKNKAYKLENQRRQDLNKRYGPKKEEAIPMLMDAGIAMSEESASVIYDHMSNEWFNYVFEGYEAEA